MSREPLRIVCWYVDLGRPYLPLIKRMTESAKTFMPDCETAILTPTPSDDLYACFDTCVHINVPPNAKSIASDRAKATWTWQANSNKPTIYIDPDVEFIKPVEFPNADVGLLYRPKSAQCVNEAMIFARPGCPSYWEKYAHTALGLPRSLHPWWASQMAHSMIVGTLRKQGDVIQAYDATLALLNPDDICANPDRITEKAVAIHYKGIRKGAGWEKFFAVGSDEGLIAA